MNRMVHLVSVLLAVTMVGSVQAANNVEPANEPDPGTLSTSDPDESGRNIRVIPGDEASQFRVDFRMESFDGYGWGSYFYPVSTLMVDDPVPNSNLRRHIQSAKDPNPFADRGMYYDVRTLFDKNLKTRCISNPLTCTFHYNDLSHDTNVVNRKVHPYSNQQDIEIGKETSGLFITGKIRPRGEVWNTDIEVEWHTPDIPKVYGTNSIYTIRESVNLNPDQSSFYLVGPHFYLRMNVTRVDAPPAPSFNDATDTSLDDPNSTDIEKDEIETDPGSIF